MKRAISTILAAGAAAVGLAVVPGTAHAGPQACTTLAAPGGGSATVCKTYVATGGGLYKGTFSVNSASSRVYVQAYQDGSVYSLTSRGGTGSGSYADVASFHLRACNSGCSSWY